MARKTIFDIFNELNENVETPKETLPVNEVPQQTVEEVTQNEEVPNTPPVKQPQVDIETINQNNTLQSVINEERGE